MRLVLKIDHPLLGDFLNDQKGRFFCPFPTCSCAVSNTTSKGWANTSSVLNHLKSQHKNEFNCLPLHIFLQLDKTFCPQCIRLYKPDKDQCQNCLSKLFRPVDLNIVDLKKDGNFLFNSLFPSILKMSWEEVALLPQAVPILSEIPPKQIFPLAPCLCVAEAF